MQPDQKPKISVITPSFNQFRFLPYTVESVLQQDYPNLEYIIVDGSSTDGSIDYLLENEHRLSRLIIEPDHGHANALNKGFSCSTGEIMCWLNSDDLLTPWCLDTVANIFTSFPDVDWIQGMASQWNLHGQMVSVACRRVNLLDCLAGRGMWLQQESVFWRRSLWEKSGACLDETVRFMVDTDLWFRFFDYADLTYVNCVLAGYRRYGDNRFILNSDRCLQEIVHLRHSLRSRHGKLITVQAKAIVGCYSLLRKSLFLPPAVVRLFFILYNAIAKRLWGGLHKQSSYAVICWDFEINNWVKLRLGMDTHS